MSRSCNGRHTLHLRSSSFLSTSNSTQPELPRRERKRINSMAYEQPFRDSDNNSSVDVLIEEDAPTQNVVVAATSSSSSSSSMPAIVAMTRHLVQPNGAIVGRQVAETILPVYRTFGSAIPNSSSSPRPALASIDGRHPIDHGRIVQFIMNQFGPTLHQLGFGKGHRVALVLPNGPELALAIVATAHWASAVPLSATGATAELQADLERCGADLVIGPYTGPMAVPASGRATTAGATSPHHDGTRFHVMEPANYRDWSSFASLQESVEQMGIPYVGLIPSPTEAGIFQLVPYRYTEPIHFGQGLPVHKCFVRRQQERGGTAGAADNNNNKVNTDPNLANDEVLVLFTSGTTGDKKLVPHQLGDMLTAAVTIALSWALTPQDVNCNLMPLFHVGGIVRQVFAPLISGGCVICCPSFDPSIFWALLSKQCFNWYYAAPTVHQIILQTHDVERCPDPRLRMIANAAGGLLPSLAIQLREAFHAYVLPSYGMTECMPITSPPSNYELTKPGTSGVPVGPEVAILNLTTMTPLPSNTEGPICVRGAPCFRGYGRLSNQPNEAVPDSILEGGWFNTGDLGYLDDDGYLYISGRSKEVINRGGETISPMEVEEAVLSHEAVASCAAFSAPHDVLQEVVGIVLVTKNGYPRLDLPSLHEYLGDRLAAPKWPQCLVFLDSLPKSHTNKLLRVRLAERLGLPQLRNDMTSLERTFEGQCPPQGTGLDVLIPVTNVRVAASAVQGQLAQVLNIQDSSHIRVVPNIKRPGTLICYLYGLDRVEAIEKARKALDRYAIPTHFVSVDCPIMTPDQLPIPQPTDTVTSIYHSLSSPSAKGPIDPMLKGLQEDFIALLNLDYVPGPDANFFHLGGSSLLASQLASKIRKYYEVPCSGAEIFRHTSCHALAKMIRQRSSATSDDGTSATTGSTDLDASQDDSTSHDEPWVKRVTDHGAHFASKHMSPLFTKCGTLFQLVPLFVVFPIWQVTRYLLFFAVLLVQLELVPRKRDLGTFVVAYLIFNLCWVTFTPLVFVAIKWAVIGRYREGRYRIGSAYYLRWWFVDICRNLFVRGVWGYNDSLLCFYYRLLGAKIGRGARISVECDLAEFDLITIERGASLELSTCRAFGVDNGGMILGHVRVGQHASVGVRSVVAPYTSVPDGCNLGPATSSYDLKAIRAKHASYNRKCLPEPSLWLLIFVAAPILLLVDFVRQIPPLVVLFALLHFKDEHHQSFSSSSELMRWLCHPSRVPFFIGIRVARSLLSPFFYMTAAVFVKKLIIGKFKPGPRDVSNQWELLRHYLAETLLSHSKIQEIADLVGRHYELVSCLYRLLGAKVGKRVFWPGHQPVFSGEFDLLEIGDDVVFGSRSTILCTTIDSCEPVKLCAGANVADNCVVLPGSIVGKNAVLGSNSVCPAGWYLPEGSVWFGANGSEPVCLEPGVQSRTVELPIHASTIGYETLQFAGDASTLRPFGKAFYLRQATYCVWPLSFIVAASVAVNIFTTTFHSLPLLFSAYGGAGLVFGFSLVDNANGNKLVDYYQVYFSTLVAYGWLHMIRVAFCFIIDLSAKWALMGRRVAGRYNYDSSSYAQRWEMYQLIASIRSYNSFNLHQFLFGTPYISAYVRWNGGTVGRNCCLYPTGADPFMPEPDLVVLGDGCVVDNASLISHLNTRGNFELAKIVVEDNCTLRACSRVQQGVHMESGAQLLEKSVVMTGEVVEANSYWQGSPAWWFQYSKNDVLFAEDNEEDDANYDESIKLLAVNNVACP